MRNIFFDAAPYAGTLNALYLPDQTHFSYLDDGEIVGGGAWLAQAGENLHVTFQSAHPARTSVAHYFYNKAPATWRCHLKNVGSPIPYGNHAHVNLLAVQQRAIQFAWPPAVVVIDGAALKVWKTDKKARRKVAEQAKKSGGKNAGLMDELFPSKGSISSPGSLRPVRFVPPAAGRITVDYVNALIGQHAMESLEYIFKSDDWKLEKWDAEAWSRFMDWNASGI
jgi:hypothetical protein